MKPPATLQISTFLAISLVTISTAAFSQTPAPHPPSAIPSASYGNLPLSFEANRGQTDPSVQFLVHGQGYTLFLRPGEAILTLQPAIPKTKATPEAPIVRMKLLGTDLKAAAVAENPQITRTNYFLGNNPAQWRTDIPNYSRVRYRSLYEGIDLVYYGNQRQLEHDFIVAPNANPGKIILSLSGAQTPQIDPATGDLILLASTSENKASLRLLKPITYQETNGHRTDIPTSYKLLAGNKVAFTIGSYDHTQPLVIDPVLVYSTYLGGSGQLNSGNYQGDEGNGIAVDSTGNAYVVGSTYSADFPVTTGALQSQSNAAQGQGTIFVTKLNAAGSALIFSTYLGGSGGDYGFAIALDPANNVYIAGATRSTDFPVTCGAYQSTDPSTKTGTTTPFVAALNASGNALTYSTYLGGKGAAPIYQNGDEAEAIAVDASGSAYVAGFTSSPDFPVTANSFQPEIGGTTQNVFVTKLNPTGTGLVYSTFLGGSGGYFGGDFGNAIAVDKSGDAFIAGEAQSSNFPVTSGAFQTTLKGTSNAFVTELNPAGTEEIYSTYLGGASNDTAQAIAVDKSGFVYVAGNTNSNDFPLTSGAVEGTGNPIGPFEIGGGAFVSKITADGSALQYSTYLEGQGTSVSGLAVDSAGAAYISGSASTYAAGTFKSFQPTPDALATPSETTAAFLVKLDPAATVFNYATLLGGSSVIGDDQANAVALDSDANVYLTGSASSTDFPVTAGAFQTHSATHEASLIPTSMSILSESFNCSLQAPGYTVVVSLLVASAASFGPSPTGSVSLTGSFNVYDDQSVVADGPGSATVQVTGVDGGVAQGAAWTAEYSGDSAFAPSILSGSVSSTIDCDSQPFVRSGAGGKASLPRNRQAVSIGKAGNTAANKPVSHIATNAGGVGESNAFISKFALAAESNQTAYPAPSVTQIGTNLFAFATISNVDCSQYPDITFYDAYFEFGFSQDAPGPPVTGTISGTFDASPPYNPYPQVTGQQFFGNMDLQYGPGPIVIGVSETYSGDLNYLPSTANTTASDPGCSGSTSVRARTDRTGQSELALRSTQTLQHMGSSALSRITQQLHGYGPKFSPPLDTRASSSELSSVQPRNSSAPVCIAPAVAAAPVFSLAAGSYTSVQTVNITDSTSGAAIYYTTNGTTPTSASARYTGPILLRSSLTLQAIAYAPSIPPSSVASATYTFNAAAPVFNPPSGAYPGPLTVTITSATPTAEIAYTPSSSSPSVYAVYTGPIAITASGKYDALAQETGFTRSTVTEAVYTIESPAATPVFSLPTGNYLNAQLVTIVDAIPGATIYYTTNGTAPTTSSTVYTGPITVPATETLEAIAIAAGYTNSAVAAATYTIHPSTTGELQFIAIAPCRIVDTRNPAEAFGGPELAAAASRTFDIPQSACNIPATATAYSLNVTVVPDQSLGYLTLWPAGQPQPSVSTLNSDGRVKANAAITPAGANGGVSVYASDATQFILDIDGYFVPAGASVSGLEFYPLTPCRIADTRNATGALGGPFLAANTSRDFPVRSSACGIPATAAAYSLNVTAIPHNSLGYLTAWPTGQPQPLASTLNASTGAVTANAAIVSAGSRGAVSIFVSDDADVILDVNGYFAAPATGGLSLYTVTPCRVLDTRGDSGAFDGLLAVAVEASACAPPATAQAYVLNATVVPAGGLSYLTLWSGGATQPDVSTLNADDGAITSNMAIVAVSNGTIDAFSTDSTQLILDLLSYFAP